MLGYYSTVKFKCLNTLLLCLVAFGFVFESDEQVHDFNSMVLLNWGHDTG